MNHNKNKKLNDQKRKISFQYKKGINYFKDTSLSAEQTDKMINHNSTNYFLEASNEFVGDQFDCKKNNSSDNNRKF